MSLSMKELQQLNGAMTAEERVKAWCCVEDQHVYPMDAIDDVLQGNSPREIVKATQKDTFDPNAHYFIVEDDHTLTSYDDMTSIANSRVTLNWLRDNIDTLLDECQWINDVLDKKVRD